VDDILTTGTTSRKLQRTPLETIFILGHILGPADLGKNVPLGGVINAPEAPIHLDGLNSETSQPHISRSLFWIYNQQGHGISHGVDSRVEACDTEEEMISSNFVFAQRNARSTLPFALVRKLHQHTQEIIPGSRTLVGILPFPAEQVFCVLG